jgi:leucyl-tRNA synthetase
MDERGLAKKEIGSTQDLNRSLADARDDKRETIQNDKEIKSLLHKTIKKVSEDIAEFKFNTAVSQMMIFLNGLEAGAISQEDFGKFIQILAPFAPHLAEEIWREKLGNKESVFKSAWPEYDKELIKDETINLVVQINGKLRAAIEVSADISEDEAKKAAQENDNVKKWLAGKEIAKIIFVKGKLLNLVVK